MAFASTYNFYNENGYAVVEDFVSPAEIAEMKKSCWQIVDDMTPDPKMSAFSADSAHNNNYFLNSAQTIGFFFEPQSRDEKGNLIIDKHEALNKIGHALHTDVPEFKKVCTSPKLQELLKAFGFKKPQTVQSMYIFKNAKYGGVVGCHQDATFLMCEPEGSLLGLWIPLDDATLENGCLWFAKGSHKSGVLNDRRWIRNPECKSETDLPLKFTAELKEIPDDSYTACPVKAGSLVLIHGAVVHRSFKNDSNKPRNAFTFHLFDAGTSKWSDRNWLPQPNAEPIYSLE